MLTMTVLDYEVLARQKRERLLDEADRLRVLVHLAEKPRRGTVRTLLARVLAWRGLAERRAVGARVA